MMFQNRKIDVRYVQNFPDFFFFLKGLNLELRVLNENSYIHLIYMLCQLRNIMWVKGYCIPFIT